MHLGLLAAYDSFCSFLITTSDIFQCSLGTCRAAKKRRFKGKLMSSSLFARYRTRPVVIIIACMSSSPGIDSTLSTQVCCSVGCTHRQVQTLPGLAGADSASTATTTRGVAAPTQTPPRRRRLFTATAPPASMVRCIHSSPGQACAGCPHLPA